MVAQGRQFGLGVGPRPESCGTCGRAGLARSADAASTQVNSAPNAPVTRCVWMALSVALRAAAAE